jgi:ribonuclease P protein component
MSGPYACPKRIRLLKRGSFKYVEARGLRIHHQAFTIVSIAMNDPIGRFGLSVSKKVGGAVVRNLIKRRLRFFMRHHKDYCANRHLVIIAKKEITQMSMPELADALHRSFQSLAKRQKKSHDEN